MCPLSFFIKVIKKACEKYMLLKQYVIFTCQETHVNLICGLQKISHKPVCRKFLSLKKPEVHATCY
jgi:hypothetical protein